MNYAITRARTAVPPSSSPRHQAIKRIFDNSQLLERFEKWLLICGKAKNTRIAYAGAAKQFANFIEKPLTAVTKEDVRAFIGNLYAKGFAPTTLQARLDALRTFFDFLQLGDQIRVSVPRQILRRKLPHRLPSAKSEEEIEKIIAAARTPRMWRLSNSAMRQAFVSKNYRAFAAKI